MNDSDVISDHVPIDENLIMKVQRLEFELDEMRSAFISLTSATQALMFDLGRLHMMISRDELFERHTHASTDEELTN